MISIFRLLIREEGLKYDYVIEWLEQHDDKWIEETLKIKFQY